MANTAPGGIQFNLNSLFGQAKGALEHINFAKPTAAAPDDSNTKKVSGQQPSEGSRDGFFGWNPWAGSSAGDPGKENRGNAHAGAGSRPPTAGLSPKISQNPFMQQNSMHPQQGGQAKGQAGRDAGREQLSSAEGRAKSARRVSSEMQVTSGARPDLIPAPSSPCPHPLALFPAPFSASSSSSRGADRFRPQQPPPSSLRPASCGPQEQALAANGAGSWARS